MNKMILKLIPGLLPIIIYVIVDEFLGTRAGIYAAIIFGIIELVVIWVKEHKIDRFIIFDTLLIVVLGAVSIGLDSDIFFKLKPGIIGLIISFLLGISSFSKYQVMQLFFKRYLKNMQLNDFQWYQMLVQLKALFYISIFHTALVFYSIWFMSDKAWAFISSVLLYVLVALYFVFQLAKKKFPNVFNSDHELLPVVDDAGNLIGKASRKACHSNKLLLHPVVHLHVFDAQGKLFLQKRAQNKKVQPGKWDTAVGGHVDFGENIEQSLKREAAEELNLSDFNAQLIAKYLWESDIERELVFVFATTYNKNITVNRDEISEGKFWDVKEINDNLKSGIFTPNFTHEISKMQLLN